MKILRSFPAFHIHSYLLQSKYMLHRIFFLQELFNRFAKMAKVTSGASNLHSEQKIISGRIQLFNCIDSKMTLGVRNLPFLSPHQLRSNFPMIHFLSAMSLRRTSKDLKSSFFLLPSIETKLPQNLDKNLNSLLISTM